MGGPTPQIDFDALGPDLSGSYSVAGIEVTQAVQDMNHSVPLVAGKATMIRVYLDRPEPATVTVRGEIAIVGDQGSAAVPSLDTLDLDRAVNGNLAARRLSLATSLNFVVPNEVNVAGAWTVRVARIFTLDTGSELTNATPAVSRDFDLIEAPPLRVRVISFRHQGGNPVTTFEPRALDYEMLASWLRRAYPVPEVIISRVTTDASRRWKFTATQVNAQITAMRNLDLASGGDPLAHYIGIVSDGGGRTAIRGKASAIPDAADPSAVASAPVGAALFAWDTDGSYADWYVAHELAHTFGRRHIGACPDNNRDDVLYPFPNGALSDADEAFVGFDVGDPALGMPMKICQGTTSHDVMSYCESVWMSAYTYRAILERLTDEAGIAAGPPIGAILAAAPLGEDFQEDAMPEPTEWLNIIGTVDLTDGSGTIDYVQPLTAANAPREESPDVTIVLFNAQDERLDVIPARMKLDTCLNEDEHVEGVIDTFVPQLQGIARIELRIADQPVASYIVPRPVDEGLAGPLAAGEAAPNARYNVQVSPDQGATWQTVAVGITDPAQYSVNRSDFPGAGSLRRRVLETSGLSTMVVEDETI